MRFLLIAFIAYGCALLTGCEQRQTAAPVDSALAVRTLEDVLDRWKSGGNPADFQTTNPAVVVQDLDWQQGLALDDYEIQGAGKPEDANLLCDVRLTLQGKDGKVAQKTVTYIVGTDPVLTVFRKIF